MGRVEADCAPCGGGGGVWMGVGRASSDHSAYTCCDSSGSSYQKRLSLFSSAGAHGRAAAWGEGKGCLGVAARVRRSVVMRGRAGTSHEYFLYSPLPTTTPPALPVTEEKPPMKLE